MKVTLRKSLLRGAVILCAVAAVIMLEGKIDFVRAASTTTFHLVATASGNWNSLGQHTVGNYQIGYSTERPNKQAAYYVFDLTPVRRRTVVHASTVIPGSTDYNITDIWSGHTPEHQFKVGIAPQNVAAISLNEILNGNNDPNLYINASDAGRNQDLGYGWVQDGLHPGFAFDTDHYNTQRLQNAVNNGGLFAFWACDRFDSGAGTENYIWGSTNYNTGIILNITVE